MLKPISFCAHVQIKLNAQFPENCFAEFILANLKEDLEVLKHYYGRLVDCLANYIK